SCQPDGPKSERPVFRQAASISAAGSKTSASAIGASDATMASKPAGSRGWARSSIRMSAGGTGGWALIAGSLVGAEIGRVDRDPELELRVRGDDERPSRRERLPVLAPREPDDELTGDDRHRLLLARPELVLARRHHAD